MIIRLLVVLGLSLLPLHLVAQVESPTLEIVIKRKAVESSNLAAVGYNARAKILDVEFVSGPVYRYFDVTKATYKALLKAESKGDYFYSNIRGKFRREKLSTEKR